MDSENNVNERGASIGDNDGNNEADLESDFFGGFSMVSPGVEIVLGGRPINGRFSG